MLSPGSRVQLTYKWRPDRPWMEGRIRGHTRALVVHGKVSQLGMQGWGVDRAVTSGCHPSSPNTASQHSLTRGREQKGEFSRLYVTSFLLWALIYGSQWKGHCLWLHSELVCPWTSHSIFLGCAFLKLKTSITIQEPGCRLSPALPPTGGSVSESLEIFEGSLLGKWQSLLKRKG